MTREEELAGRHLEFAHDILHIEVAEREDYSWPCAKCGMKQEDHNHSNPISPAAGECEFEPTPTKPKKGEKTDE